MMRTRMPSLNPHSCSLPSTGQPGSGLTFSSDDGVGMSWARVVCAVVVGTYMIVTASAQVVGQFGLAWNVPGGSGDTVPTLCGSSGEKYASSVPTICPEYMPAPAMIRSFCTVSETTRSRCWRADVSGCALKVPYDGFSI